MKKARLLLLLLPIIGAVFYLRSLASWRPKKVFTAPGQIWQLAFSNDGKTLIVGHGVSPPGPAIISGQISPEPPTIAVALDVQKGFDPLWEYKDIRSFTGLQFFAHDSQILKHGNSIQLLDARTGIAHKDYGRLIGSATVSPDGKWLAYKRLNVVDWWQQDGRIFINPANAARQEKSIRAEKVIGQKSDEVDAFGFSPDGQTFAVGVGDKNGARLDFYNTTTWKLARSWGDTQCQSFNDHNESLLPPPIQWSRDGHFLLPSRTYAEGLRVYHVSASKKLTFSSLSRPYALPPQQVTPHLELEDKERVLSYGDEGKVLLSNSPTAKTDFETLLDLRQEKVTAATLSPDGSCLVAGTASGNIFYQRVK